MVARLEGTEAAKDKLKRVRYTHDAMIDVIIAQPTVTVKELAAMFGRERAWLSQIMNSDAFQERLAVRRSELLDDSLRGTFEEKLKGAADMSLDIIMEKLDKTENVDTAFKLLDITTKSLGYGARVQAPTNVAANQTNVVVVVPAKAGSSEDWQEKYMKGTGPRPEVGLQPATLQESPSNNPAMAVSRLGKPL